MSSEQKKRPTLALYNGEKYLFITESDILYCMADANRTTIYLSDNSITSVSKALSELEVILGNRGFVRIHKSYLINILHVEQYMNHNENNVLLTNGHIVPIAKRRKQVLLDHFVRI